MLDQCRPAAFLLENVANLLKHERGRTLATIKRHLQQVISSPPPTHAFCLLSWPCRLSSAIATQPFISFHSMGNKAARSGAQHRTAACDGRPARVAPRRTPRAARRVKAAAELAELVEATSCIAKC